MLPSTFSLPGHKDATLSKGEIAETCVCHAFTVIAGGKFNKNNLNADESVADIHMRL
jgi:hypothetical protein